MAYSILKITDGETKFNPDGVTIDLLSKNRGFLLNDWQPQIAPYKGGGVWQNSPLTDGRRLALRNFDNTVETFDLVVSGPCQDDAIEYIRNLTNLLEKATSYWTTSWQHEPVWLEVRGAKETETRYALIKGYTLGGLNNPFRQPFYGRIRSTMKDLTLVIERDHWLDHQPGDSHCVDLNTLQLWENVTTVTQVHYHEVASGDDMYAFVGDSGTATIAGLTNYVGIIAPDSYNAESGLRFDNVNIPQGAEIVRAYLEVMAVTGGGFADTYNFKFIIAGDDVDDATLWGSYAPMPLYDEYIYRKTWRHTTASVAVPSPAGSWKTNKEVHYIYGLESIVQELVDRPGWAANNAIALFVGSQQPLNLPAHDVNSRNFASWDQHNADATYAEPILHIDYITTVAAEIGREETCTGKVHVANKHNTAQPTHIYSYDASKTAYTLVSGGIGTLLPSPPEVNDCIYIGIDASITDHGPFDSLAFDLSTAASGTPLTWWYATADGPPVWAALQTFGADNLVSTGETLVWWSQPSNWVECTINGVLGWWIRVLVGVVAAPAAPVQHDRPIYSVIVPFVDIEAEDVPGEITALGRIRIEGNEEFGMTGSSFEQTLVAVAGRSKSRGLNFSPYLNFSRVQNPQGVTFDSSVAPTADATAPTGWSKYISITGPSTVWSEVGQFSINGITAPEYRGSYHVYLRCKQSHYAAGDMRVRARFYPTTGSATLYTDEKPTLVEGSPHMIDLGIIEFGSGTSLMPGDAVESAQIIVEHWSNLATEMHMTYYDLILFPVDEWTGIYNTTTDDWEMSLYGDTLLDIDSTSTFRTQRAILRRLYTGPTDPKSGIRQEYLVGEWTRQARGGPFLQANSDQRLWFLFSRGTTFKADFRPKFNIRVYRNSRYLTMRGDE